MSGKPGAPWAGWPGPSPWTSSSVPTHTGVVPEFRENNEKLLYQMAIRCCQFPAETLRRMPRKLALSVPLSPYRQGHLSEMSLKSTDTCCWISTPAPSPLRWTEMNSIVSQRSPVGLNHSCLVHEYLLYSLPSLPCLASSLLTLFAGITSRINDLHLYTHFRVYLGGQGDTNIR